jgi:hypothetical protein
VDKLNELMGIWLQVVWNRGPCVLLRKQGIFVLDGLIHAVNNDLVVMPGGISNNYILVNKSFKDHLKQLYSEWPLAGHYVLKPTGPKRKPSIELLCQWMKFMAGNSSLQK